MKREGERRRRRRKRRRRREGEYASLARYVESVQFKDPARARASVLLPLRVKRNTNRRILLTCLLFSSPLFACLLFSSHSYYSLFFLFWAKTHERQTERVKVTLPLCVCESAIMQRPSVSPGHRRIVFLFPRPKVMRTTCNRHRDRGGGHQHETIK